MPKKEIICEDVNAEQHAGERIPDPWADPEQTDWPNGEVDTNGGDSGSGAEGVRG